MDRDRIKRNLAQKKDKPRLAIPVAPAVPPPRPAVTVRPKPKSKDVDRDELFRALDRDVEIAKWITIIASCLITGMFLGILVAD